MKWLWGLFQKAINIDQNCKKACNYLVRTRSKLDKKTKQERTAPEGTALIFESEFQIKHNDRTVPDDKKSIYSIYIDSFYTDKYTVTNAQYKKFLDANPQWSKNLISREYHDGSYLKHWYQNNYPSGEGYSPVVYVSWYASNGLCTMGGQAVANRSGVGKSRVLWKLSNVRFL